MTRSREEPLVPSRPRSKELPVACCGVGGIDAAYAFADGNGSEKQNERQLATRFIFCQAFLGRRHRQKSKTAG